MDTDHVEMDENGEPMEAVLSSGKRHANLVATIAWCASLLAGHCFLAHSRRICIRQCRQRCCICTDLSGYHRL